MACSVAPVVETYVSALAWLPRLALEVSTVGEPEARSPSGGILVERQGDRLRAVVRGGYVPGFWVAMTLAGLFLVASSTVVAMTWPKLEFLILLAVGFWGCIVAYILTGPRKETIILDRKSIRRFGRSTAVEQASMATHQIATFECKRTGFGHSLRGTLAFDGMGRRILFATARDSSRGAPRKAINAVGDVLHKAFSLTGGVRTGKPSRSSRTDEVLDELPIAVQATESDLVWLKDQLDKHLERLRGYSGDTDRSEPC